MSEIEPLLEIMRRLRDPENGCPWDRQQTYQSLVSHTLEEAYEVAETIEQHDLAHLPDELGDLLFQVVFYARLAEEEGRFDFAGVVRRICDKLVRRHPHVFAATRVDSAAAQTREWEAHKQREREQQGDSPGLLDGVSLTLPALTRALKLQRRAARAGFDWPSVTGVLDKVREEFDEVAEALHAAPGSDRVVEEIGDLLFSVVNLTRHLDVDPETALRRANRKFERRFGQVETRLRAQGGIEQASLAEMDAAWEAVKRSEA
ncbi:MAG: nucleoside triphosphate pyrophosphohydrolase [Proteobacteria bacterium]|jgi:nucleoside triphosphate diphosphatase|nr:nucleoside triphosphate pyrophosphohydrolase [Pseudomonadota bacterium]